MPAVFKKLKRRYIGFISKKFEDFIEQDISCICITNKKGDIVKVNSNFKLLFNYSEKEILGQNVKKIIPQKYRTAHEHGMRRHQKTGESKVIGKGEVELEGLKKNGETIPIMMRLSKISILGEDYFYATINDLSELKQKEKQIESISRFPEENPQFVLRVDKNANIIYANLSSRNFFAKISYSSKKSVIRYLKSKVDFICEVRKPFNEELKVEHDNYYLSFVPILDKYYFNVYVTRITDYVAKVEEREQKLKTLSEELTQRVESQVGEIKEKNQI